MNTISLLGRLTDTPELKTTQNGVSVTSFTLAVDRAYTPKGQEKQTDFINCKAWRNTADFVCNYFHKGQRMALTGSLQSRAYTDKSGNNRVAFEVVADNVFFADSKKEGGEQAPSNVTPIAPAQTPLDSFTQNAVAQGVDFEEIVGSDDLPF